MILINLVKVNHLIYCVQEKTPKIKRLIRYVKLYLFICLFSDDRNYLIMKVFKDQRLQNIFRIWSSVLTQVDDDWSVGWWISGKWSVGWWVGGLLGRCQVGRWSVVLIKPVTNRDVKEVVKKRLKDAVKRKGGEKKQNFQSWFNAAKCEPAVES